MPRPLPPIDKRFPINRPYAPNAGNKGPYLLPLLKRFLEKKIDYIDPETNEKIKGRVKDAVLWRLLLNACQGENDAIKEVLNRVDGKVAEIIKHEEATEALVQEEIELIPSDGNGRLDKIQAYLKKQE